LTHLRKPGGTSRRTYLLESIISILVRSGKVFCP